MSNKARIEVDYNGNTYIRFGNQIYNIFFDPNSQNGIEISPISNNQLKELTNLCLEYSYMKKHLIKGKIILSDSTLKGRVTKVLSELNADELDEETELNMLNALNKSFVEESFFRIVKETNNLDDLENDWEDDWDIGDTDEKFATSHDLEYRFSGIKEYEEPILFTPTNDNTIKFETDIYFSNVLGEMKSHNDTLMIRGQRDSKIVTSCVQRTDGFCTNRLIFYSESGHIKVHYPSNQTIFLRIIKTDSGLNLEFINKLKD